MTTEEKVHQLEIRVTKQEESLKSAHRRLDENDALTNQIHMLATNIETLTLQVKLQNEKIEKIIDTLEERLKRQGERICNLETKPAKHWDAIVKQMVSIVVATVMGIVLAKIGML